jgi:hypothetical protein
MGLEVYYPTDVRNALLAAEQAVNAMADAAAVGTSTCPALVVSDQDTVQQVQGRDDVDCPQSAFTAGFLTGYRAALTTLALAFGLGLKAELSSRPEPPLEEQKTAFLAVTPPSPRRRR